MDTDPSTITDASTDTRHNIWRKVIDLDRGEILELLRDIQENSMLRIPDSKEEDDAR